MDLFSMINWERLAVANEVEGYEYCRFTKAYLDALARKAGIDFSHRPCPASLVLMEKAGYKNWSKFLTHLAEWHALTRPMPRTHFEALGGELRILETALEADREAFERALAACTVPRHWTRRIMPAVYFREHFPPGLATQEECVDYVLQCCAITQCRACIDFPGLKTIWCKPDGGCFETLRRPGVKLSKHTLEFDADGAGIATTRIG
jgi:hypothetical protein